MTLPPAGRVECVDVHPHPPSRRVDISAAGRLSVAASSSRRLAFVTVMASARPSASSHDQSPQPSPTQPIDDVALQRLAHAAADAPPPGNAATSAGSASVPSSSPPGGAPLAPHLSPTEYTAHPRVFIRSRPLSSREVKEGATLAQSRVRLSHGGDGAQVRVLEPDADTPKSGTATAAAVAPPASRAADSAQPDASSSGPLPRSAAPKTTTAPASTPSRTFSVDGVLRPHLYNAEQIRLVIHQRVALARTESQTWPTLAHRVVPQHMLPSAARCHFDRLPSVLVTVVCHFLEFVDIVSLIGVNRHVRDTALQPISWRHVASSLEAEQEGVYQRTTRQLVHDLVWQGESGAVFAYGQTGAGKTTTMSGVPDHAPGLIDRAARDLFTQLAERLSSEEARHAGLAAVVRVSYIVLSREELHDAFTPSGPGRRAWMERRNLRERPPNELESAYLNGVLYIPDLITRRVPCLAEARQAVRDGERAHKIEVTMMSASSSRHTVIVSLHVDFRSSSGPSSHRQASLHFVDLCGSERLVKTGASGDRLAEARMINLSVTALGNVVAALVQLSTPTTARKPTHIPYRDSRLTRLMACAIGGTMPCVWIGHVTPYVANTDEALATVRFIHRVRAIKKSCIPVSDARRSVESSRWMLPDPWTNEPAASGSSSSTPSGAP